MTVKSAECVCRGSALSSLGRTQISSHCRDRSTVSTAFHGHAKGEIRVAIDLVTREVCLWLLPNRKQDSVSRALLSGLVFVKGVPLAFRSDNAPELMSGLVSAMNHYLGVEQITTGGYNPRGNAIVELFMHTLARAHAKNRIERMRSITTSKTICSALRSRTIAHTAQSLSVRLSRLVTAYEPEPSPKQGWLSQSSNS